jgi:hypothetical protein
VGVFNRQDFGQGWQPSADAFNAPKNALLRMDNLVLDELGAVALRQGSLKVNSSAFADTDVHSLFTGSINGSRLRMSGATSAVYANGVSIASGVAGTATDEISFSSHMGHILFARSTTKKKYDGTTVRNWGIDAPNAAPTLAAIAADSKVFASCASTELPVVTANEGSVAFQPDRAGTANAAAELTPNTTTGRATATKTFAAATNFTTYDAGQTGTDDDLIDFFNYVTEPQFLDTFTLMIDVNDGTFELDWYEHTFKNGDAIEVVPGVEESLASNYTVEAEDRDRVLSDIEDRGSIQTSFRQDQPVVNAGWNHFSIPRGQMTRHGLTAGQNWSTVRAVRVVVVGIAGGAGAAVRIDEIKIIGGAARPLTGKFKAAVVAVRNDGTYQALSGPSAFSSEIEVKAQGIRATVASGVISALDTQVNELWLYLMGGRLKAFYRFAVKTGGPFSGAQTIDATSSEITALIADLQMETDNAVPPDGIIGIAGPHFDRTLTLTAQFIYPSRQRNPDSYSAGEAVRVGDAAETALWIRKVSEGGLFVGTTRDVYRLDGDWTKLPDGSINVYKRPLGVSTPPISAAVATGKINGSESLVYLSGSGWQVLYGGTLTDSAVELLWRGETRHGVSHVNITDTASRFRCAITKNQFTAITPEGSSTTSSTVLHKYDFQKQRWYRHTYTPSWRSILAEPDGTLIAGDSAGFVRTLDLATKLDDGTAIPIVMWTPHDDNGEPFTYKEAEHLHFRCDTGEGTVTINFHLNGNAVSDHSETTSQGTADTAAMNVSAVSPFSQLQLRMTGSLSTFVFRGLRLNYLDNPMPMLIHDTGFVDLSTDVLKWVFRIRVKARSTVNMTVTPYWDGTAGTARSVSVAAHVNKPFVFDVPLGREDKGRVARAVITATEPFHVYWVEFQYNGSGKPVHKRISLEPEIP